ncbi:chromosome segregation protein SMC [Thiocapsa imhoffii]|uniref:Chromosome partition protein Smc n=1 Tax=Thiocapsa imhoffii TaxID=382777 RepID=A0A9X0WF93_9GAMM|nr:chromosome segregation protein SMC [Thiocapsa imhoffii]MBK1643621.1 chromosome segregation protein SMC [Thiocapsa imhoffii]
MRLEKIRLAGFKSFVDPTTVRFPSNLVGVVGPNGCGKSNVIDAVRWVMGESSAKMLRGESMADVIFNGSSGRQPVGVASIELVFDNTDGRAGGAYASFNQISVKRQVSRDGQSIYSLNGSRCRRRDIQDLFLGTGLGPRSYAIIEQGMISRIIEARPEDLRLFLEEAAGISKYKERRRETESRMRQTRENLERLDDLRTEVGQQLLHLERQAAAAERYSQLKSEERRLDLELTALRWRQLDDEIQTQEQGLTEAQTRQAAAVTRQRRLEAEIEAGRAAYQEASEDFNQVQGRFYAVGAEIARAEQAIQFANETRGHREGELLRLDQELSETTDHAERDQQRLQEIDTGLAGDEPALDEAESALAEVLTRVRGAETRLHDWETVWDDFSREAAGPIEQAQAARSRITGLEQSAQRDHERLRRLDDEAAHRQALDLDDQLKPLAEQEADLDAERATLETRQACLDQTLATHEARRAAGVLELDRTRTALQESRGRLASLHALQEEALRAQDPAETDWLEQRGLAEAPRLIDQLEVDAGWENALEAVLGEALHALGTEDLAAVLADGRDPPPGLVLIETSDEGGHSSPPTGCLRAYLRCPWPLETLIGSARPVADLPAAMAIRATLTGSEQLVTPQGVRVGRDWLKTPSVRVGGGAIARAESIKQLSDEISQYEAELKRHEEEGARLGAEQARMRTECDANARRGREIDRQLSELKAELASLRAQREHRRERLLALQEERTELQARIAETLEEIEETREQLHEALDAANVLATRRETMQAERTRLRAELEAEREQERLSRERGHGLRVRVESSRAARAATVQSRARLEERRALLDARRRELLEALAADLDPLADQRARLDEQLARRVEVEQDLARARTRLEQLDAQVRALEQERQRVEQAEQLSRQELDQLRLAHQERLVRRQTLVEQLAAAQQTPNAVLNGMDPAANESVWQDALAKTSARIQRLGPVNLAAVEEYRQQRERKAYLDAQHEDISHSLDTLEHAIRKIDRETRHRFRETYEQVNQGFQQLFPRLFGGGQARLELTDEDLLETGVSVMARPPGKRNASIHLLSGGEKALTAVALVFAIFELNPAPFCMLDEVDAPLDEANVGRFCELVRSMSQRVQFVFISHNKVTMEIAEHLLGVTMHEPGVSRLVAVDVNEAVRLAAVS